MFGKCPLEHDFLNLKCILQLKFWLFWENKCSFILMFICHLHVEEDRHCLFENKYSLNEAVDAIDLLWYKLVSCELCNCSWQLSAAEFICSVKHPIIRTASATPAIRKLYFPLLTFSMCFKTHIYSSLLRPSFISLLSAALIIHPCNYTEN